MTFENLKSYFLAMIAEMGIVVINMLNIFFVSRYLGATGVATYELIFPVMAVIVAIGCLFYTGTQTICAKDYGAADPESFAKHRNAAYSWVITVMGTVMILLYVLQAPVLDLLGANDGDPQLYQLSSQCYSWFLPSMIPGGVYVTACSLLYFEEKRSLLIANLILFVSMILGSIAVVLTSPSMTGFIVINTMAYCLADIYIFFIHGAHHGKARAAFSGLNFKWGDVKEVIFAGIPDFMEYIFVALATLVINLYGLSRFSSALVSGIGVFEGFDNLTEIVCVGIAFLSTATLGTGFGRLQCLGGDKRKREETQFYRSAGRLTGTVVITGIIAAAVLLVIAKPLASQFLTDTSDREALRLAVLMVQGCAGGFIFYLLNTEIVSYYKVVRALKAANVMYIAESLVLPVISKIIFGELFGVTGFCFGGMAAEVFTFLLNVLFIWKMNGRFPLAIRDFALRKHMEA